MSLEGLELWKTLKNHHTTCKGLVAGPIEFRPHQNKAPNHCVPAKVSALLHKKTEFMVDPSRMLRHHPWAIDHGHRPSSSNLNILTWTFQHTCTHAHTT